MIGARDRGCSFEWGLFSIAEFVSSAGKKSPGTIFKLRISYFAYQLVFQCVFIFDVSQTRVYIQDMKLSVLSLFIFLIGLYSDPLPAQDLEYSTYLGGGGWDRSYGVAVDDNGSAYLVGGATSLDFPTAGPYQSGYAGGSTDTTAGDVFVSKFFAEGELIFSTYLGGSRIDSGWGVAVDDELCVYIGGKTGSNDFPTRDSYQASRNGTGAIADAFLTKFDSSGSSLIYSTYLGGERGEMGGGEGNCGLVVDSGRCAYLTGSTVSNDFPTRNAYQGARSGIKAEVFVSKFSSSGSSLVYSTYLGGTVRDEGWAIAVDTDLRAYVTGLTCSPDFPTRNPYQDKFQGPEDYPDVFVSLFSSSGSSLVYSTYLGGSNGLSEAGDGIAVGSDRSAYITGYTASNDFPTLNPYQSTSGGSEDVFISRLSSSGSSMLYSTYLGGGGDDEGWGIVLENTGEAIIAGMTESANFPTRNAYQSTFSGGGDGGDAFVSALASGGDALIYSTYLGGGSNDRGWGIAAGSSGNVYITGSTQSSDFPVVDPYQSSMDGDNDAFLAVLVYYPTPLPTVAPSVAPTPAPSSTPTPLTPTTTPLVTPSPLVKPTPSPQLILSPTPSLVPPTPTPQYPHTPTPFLSPTPVVTITCSPSITRTPASSATPTALPSSTCSLAPTAPPLDSPTPPPTPHSTLPILDFNGDGTSDIAIFRGSTGLWAIRSVTRFYFGRGGDDTVSGDYDGNGTSVAGIFRAGSGLWAIRGLTRFYFGSTSDQPVPADYDGDESSDPCIFRESIGLWAVRGLTRAYFGKSGDRPYFVYYDGNGLADIGVFRDSSGLWAIRKISRFYFGGSTDLLVSGNYTGNREWEVGIFRTSSGLWAIRSVSRIYFGGVLDAPVPADYTGSGFDTISIFRADSGLWAVRGVTRCYFGAIGDVPVTR